MMATPQCPRCGAPSRPSGSTYCNACHAERMREWRKTHPLSEEQKRKDRARSYAGTYLRRGKIARQPCRDCGSSSAEMHHEDYSKPLEVVWLCRPCHLDLHRSEDAA